MHAPIALLDHLHARLLAGLDGLVPDSANAGAGAHVGAGEDGLVSLVLALPRPPQTAPQLAGPSFQFQHRDRGTLCAGYGVAAEWEAEGPDRLARLAAVARALRASWLRHDPDETGLDAVALLGFASASEPAPMVEDHLPNALLWVPEVALTVADGAAALVLSARLPTTRAALAAAWERALALLVPALYRPASGPLPAATLTREFAEPDRDGWSALVGVALGEIDRGGLEKVVVSRRLDLAGHRPFDLGRLGGALGCLFPSCQVISLRRNGSSFVAATPERLLARRGGTVEVDAIAGTARRATEPDADAALAAALAVCDKNRREHRVVIDAIRAALAGCSSAIEVPPTPTVMQLSNAHHLWSPIRATVPAGLDLFDLAGRLHPTPATNGAPREPARAWLAAHEPFPRGWYTGAAGLLTPDLDGELWVLLRCARLCGARAELYAGAGIVAGSDPDSEWAETEAKLGAMLSALQFA